MKSTSDDRRLLLDSGVSGGERAAALDRLSADDALTIEEADALLREESVVLRIAALGFLVEGVSFPAKYVDEAIKWLKFDGCEAQAEDEELIRCNAAYALGVRAHYDRPFRPLICGALSVALITPSSMETHRSCYEALLKAEGELFPDLPTDFVGDRDIDWARVRQYLPAQS